MKPAPSWFAFILRRFGFRAITLPPFGIYYVPGVIVGPRLEKHEACHWDQYQQLGAVRFYLRYLWLSLRHGYRDNPMEIEARRAESL